MEYDHESYLFQTLPGLSTGFDILAGSAPAVQVDKVSNPSRAFYRF
jgi:hypothetical protein